MIRKGDRVKFVNDTTVGIVTAIEGKVAHVSVEDGFELPVLLTDLVVVDKEEETKAMRQMGVSDGTLVNTNTKTHRPEHKEKKATSQRSVTQYGRISLVDDFEEEDDIDLSYIKANYLKNRANANDAELRREEERVKATPSPIELTGYDVKLCFVPQDVARPEESAMLELYLVNDSSYRILYSIGRWGNGNYVTSLASGDLEEDTKELIRTYKREELSRVGKLLVNLVFYKPTNYVPQPVESFTLELSPMKFVRRGSYVENDFFDEPVVMFTLATDKEEVKQMQAARQALEQNLREEQGDVPSSSRKGEANQRKWDNEPEIIDLHAQEVLDSTEGLSNGEILQAQMARFEIALDLAVHANSRQRMVFIHGVGSGKLKREMQKLLAAKYPRLRYQDASFKEYGYGAIMVFIN